MMGTSSDLVILVGNCFVTYLVVYFSLTLIVVRVLFGCKPIKAKAAEELFS